MKKHLALKYFTGKLLTEKNKVCGDMASIAYGREFSMGLAERQQKYLEQIDEAFERHIDNGTYGICPVTGNPIPEERLEEEPIAKYSVQVRKF